MQKETGVHNQGQRKHKRGGDVKKAPPGFYTPGQAQKRLGLTQSAMRVHIDNGTLERIVSPGRTDGYYRKDQVNALADKLTLFHLQHLSTAKHELTEFGQATIDDLPGIYEVITSLGWPSTPVELRKTWYRVNDQIDYVVRFRGLVLGYINMAPYIPETMEAMISGKKRGWDIRPQDFYTFEPGNTYNCFVGIAVRQDVPGSEYYASRLILGFFGVLCDMARRGIRIHYLYATSDQPDGIKISRDLGFERQPEHPGDLFGRFALDLETSDSMFARRYREAVQQGKEGTLALARQDDYLTGTVEIEDESVRLLDQKILLGSEIEVELQGHWITGVLKRGTFGWSISIDEPRRGHVADVILTTQAQVRIQLYALRNGA